MIKAYVFVTALAILGGGLGHGDQSRFGNGRWWKSLSVDDRVSFLAGEEDCYIYDAKGKNSAPSISSQATEMVTVFYSKTGNIAVPLLSAFRRVFSVRIEHGKLTSSGENYPERHGIFDGDYWRQIGIAGRKYYVMGYLSCRSAYLNKNDHEDIREVMMSVNRWYGLRTGAEDEDGNGRNDKIGAVLTRILH